MTTKTSRRKVWIFFYGSFMNPGVLVRAGVRPTAPRRARLDGWDISIRPRATLVPSRRSSVYGILAKVTHAQLDRLYAKDWFGFGTYLPEAVMPTQEYLQKVLVTALAYKFPRRYIDRLRSFGR